MPRFVKDAFDAFIECGILTHGFLRMRCGECGRDEGCIALVGHTPTFRSMRGAEREAIPASVPGVVTAHAGGNEPALRWVHFTS